MAGNTAPRFAYQNALAGGSKLSSGHTLISTGPLNGEELNKLPMKWNIITAALLYIITLLLCLSTTLPGDSTQGDGISELNQTYQTLQSGWHPFDTFHQNDSSIVPNSIVPIFSGLLNIDPKWIYKVILPMFFALTPVILYFLYRRLFNTRTALLAACFFILIAPTYKEAPTIGKTAIAEPLAALTLLIFFSKMRYRMILAVLLMIITLMCHYTVGFFLLMFLVAISIFDRRALTPLITGMLFTIIYFHFVGNGIVLQDIASWGLTPDGTPRLTFNDPVIAAVTGNDLSGVSFAAGIARISVFLVLLVLVIGFYYLLQDKQALTSNRGYNNCLIFTALLMPVILLLPNMTRILYATRWIQIAAIIYCPLIGYTGKWIPPKVIIVLLLFQFIFTSGIFAWAIHYPGLDLPVLQGLSAPTNKP